MEEKSFKTLFDKFKTGSHDDAKEWDEQLNKWKEYEKLIKGGFPIDRWVKNSKDGYLPDFLGDKKSIFGRARIGNYDQVMIYQYTGSDSKRKNKYIDIYRKSEKSGGYFDELKDVSDDYDKIKQLLEDIVKADSAEEIYEVEKTKNYAAFSCKQILRKITVLMSLKEDSHYRYDFMWIFNDDKIKTLAKLFGIDWNDEATFFENSKNVYTEAKKWAGIDENSPKEDYIKLNKFLFNLASDNATELTDFNCVNLIFNGAPGTGKTYGVRDGIKHLQLLDGNAFKDAKYIQFHPSFTYQDFIEGIKPTGINNNGNVKLEVVNGRFKDFCIAVRRENEKFYSEFKKANHDEPKNSDYPHYYFVVDEINRGNLSKIFGETFTLLEDDYRDHDFSGNYTKENSNKLMGTALSGLISKLGSGEEAKDNKLIYKQVDGDVVFGIPFNIHFIGLMNDVDRSIDTFDLALRRRFKWITKYCDYDVISEELDDYDSDDVWNYVDSCKKLNVFIAGTDENGLGLGRSYEIGHAFFLKIKKIPGRKTITKAKKTELFNTYLLGTLKEYIRQVKDETEIDSCIKSAKAAFGID